MSAFMPRYFFDIIDAQGIQRDEAGRIFPAFQAANDEALTALLDIAREQMLGRKGGG